MVAGQLSGVANDVTRSHCPAIRLDVAHMIRTLKILLGTNDEVIGKT